ncbi:MAG: methyltransferase [bacterium]
MRRSLTRKIKQSTPRTRIAAGVLALALVFAQPTVGSWFLGLPLVLLGEAIRLWGAGYLVKTTNLIVSGPYAYIQHPLYLGTGFITPGLLIMGGAPWWLILAAMAFYIGYYVRRKHRVESGRLSGIYGEQYDQYEALVPLLIPHKPPYRLPDTPEMSWDLHRVSQNSEDGTVYALVAVALYLLIRAVWF